MLLRNRFPSKESEMDSSSIRGTVPMHLFQGRTKQELLPRLHQPGELDSSRMESGYVVRILDARNAINKINRSPI